MKAKEKAQSMIDLTESCSDVRVVALVNRKWYNPMRYLQSKLHPRKAVVQFIHTPPKSNAKAPPCVLNAESDKSPVPKKTRSHGACDAHYEQWLFYREHRIKRLREDYAMACTTIRDFQYSSIGIALWDKIRLLEKMYPPDYETYLKMQQEFKKFTSMKSQKSKNYFSKVLSSKSLPA